MEKRIANYRIVITKDHYSNGEIVFLADCPTLHVHDWGASLEKALESIKEGIELAVACLIEDGERVPVDYFDKGDFYTIAHTSITLPAKARYLAV